MALETRILKEEASGEQQRETSPTRNEGWKPAEATGPARREGAVNGDNRCQRHATSENKWRCACVLLGTSSLTEGAM